MVRKYGNRSGRHTLPQINLKAPAEAIAFWRLAAQSAGDDLSAWARRMLTEGAARQLKLDPAKAVEDLGE